MDTCYFCKGHVRSDLVTIDYRWGERLLVIEDVPAMICQQCGEKYLDNHVYRELERMARCDDPPSAQVTVDVLEYRSDESMTCYS